jgi:hypothetical protein
MAMSEDRKRCQTVKGVRNPFTGHWESSVKANTTLSLSGKCGVNEEDRAKSACFFGDIPECGKSKLFEANLR